MEYGLLSLGVTDCQVSPRELKIIIISLQISIVRKPCRGRVESALLLSMQVAGGLLGERSVQS